MTEYELVATMTAGGKTWVVPASEGRHYRTGWLRAQWTAWRWSRRAKLERDSLPPFVWRVRATAPAELPG